MSTAFTGQAIATGFERRYGVLRLLGSTPLGRAGFLVAKTLGVLAVEAVQVVLVTAVAFALGWHPQVDLQNGIQAVYQWFCDHSEWAKQVREK